MNRFRLTFEKKTSPLTVMFEVTPPVAYFVENESAKVLVFSIASEYVPSPIGGTVEAM